MTDPTDWGDLRQALWNRANGRCELCRKPLGNDGAAHHRRLRSQGGADSMANLVLLHTDCHRQVHANVLWSRRHGWIVPSWADPADRIPLPCWDTTCEGGDYEGVLPDLPPKEDRHA